MRNKFYLVPVLVAFIGLAGWTTHAHLQKKPQAKQAWEYLNVELDSQPTVSLNKLGAEGWELVDVVSGCSGTAQPSCRFWAYMKRAK